MKVIVLTSLLFFAILQTAQTCDIGEEVAKIILEAINIYTSTKGVKNENCKAVLKKKSTIEKRLVSHSPMICKTLKTRDVDCDKACEKLRKDGLQTLTKEREKFEKGEHEAVNALKKFCEKERNGCDDLSKTPKEIQDKFLENIAPNFGEFIKLGRRTGTSKYEFKLGVAMIFGGSLGVEVSNCMNEISENLPKLVKSFKGK